MLRILIFILWGIFIAGIFTWLATLNGRFETIIFGQKISSTAGLALGSVLVCFLITVAATAVIKDVMAMPGKIRAERARNRRERGMAALTRGLESVAAGDGSGAMHHARIARRNLGEGAMTRLLTAQAAQLSGDDETAGKSFSAMLEAPETEFLGLRGLYAKALREEDAETARGYAERAFSLRPNASWAFESVFDLALDRGAWGEARSYLKPATKNKTIAPDQAKRAEAALLTAEAYASFDSDDKAGALADAEKALKVAPGFSPAAVLVARLHHDGGRSGRAEKALENAFAAKPHTSIISVLVNLYGPSESKKATALLRKLANRHTEAPESALALARAFILEADYEQAIPALEKILTDKATAQNCTLMADVVAKAHGDTAARPWLARAASAERDPTPGVDGVFSYSRTGWAQLVRDYRNDGRLSPAPIDVEPQGLSQDDLKRLAPPVAALTTPPGDTADPDDEQPKRDDTHTDDIASASIQAPSDSEANTATANSPDDIDDATKDENENIADAKEAPEAEPSENSETATQSDTSGANEQSDTEDTEANGVTASSEDTTKSASGDKSETELGTPPSTDTPMDTSAKEAAPKEGVH
ncbi:MAG: heme biosynthesis HemY N-terminal domain-containing protein [Pseudomonadota bacterium]